MMARESRKWGSALQYEASGQVPHTAFGRLLGFGIRWGHNAMAPHPQPHLEGHGGRQVVQKPGAKSELL